MLPITVTTIPLQIFSGIGNSYWNRNDMTISFRTRLFLLLRLII
uniref:Uncharacterized protein n=1 Tax=Setaria italica TaxID=4555 RepID=K4ANQ7_SETIT